LTRKCSSLLLVALCLGAGCCFAQAKPDTYETDPAADPARPTVTNPAHIPPPGYLQFEQGFLEANTTPGGPDLQASVVQTTKIALDHHLMVSVQSQPFARSMQDGKASNDTGDLDLGVQVVIFDEGEGHSRTPTLAVGYLNRVRAGTSPDLDAGSFGRSLLVLASGNLFGLHYDTNLIANEQAADSPNFANHPVPRRAQWGQTLSMTRNLTEKFAISGEIWRFSQPLTGGNAIGNLYALAYTPRKTLVLDVGFSKGLTSTSTNWETFAGFTYLLPHRLWPLRKS
jgi:hypothetical protein